VIGAGHNGLVAAFYLARAGLRTLVLERRDIVGGACVTEEFAPGFRASPGAYVLSMLRPAVWRDMRLAERGVRVDAAGPALNLFPDGQRLELHDDRRATAEQIRLHDPGDADAFLRLERRMASIARALMPVFDRPPPDLRPRRAGELLGLVPYLRVGLRRRLVPEMTYLFTTSMTAYLDEWFRSAIVKSALGWEAISNTLQGPSAPGTAYGLLHDHASGVGAQEWGFVRGGMGAVTSAMAEAAREAGAEIRTGAEVQRIVTDRGGAVAAGLASGEEIRARVVVSNADPKRTFLGLLDAELELPESFVGSVRAYRCDGASVKMNLAVAELPRLAEDRSGEPQPYHRGLLQITRPLAELDADQALAAGGDPAPEPHIEVCFPSVHDASLAPPGRHVVTIGVRSQPYRLRDGSWDARREEVADRIVERLGRFLPNLPGAILHRETLTPVDLERRLSLTGGHHMHGDMTPDQLLFLRPVRGFADYRTPVRGLYLCGAGTHPGGGVTGANGRNAARQVIRDLRRRRSTR
jgi:phytoene dehydrogenase-like protein